jgi:hypothetical protein
MSRALEQIFCEATGASRYHIPLELSVAEGEGFEPSVELPPQRFSRPSHSTALAPLRLQIRNPDIQIEFV